MIIMLLNWFSNKCIRIFKKKRFFSYKLIFVVMKLFRSSRCRRMSESLKLSISCNYIYKPPLLV